MTYAFRATRTAITASKVQWSLSRRFIWDHRSCSIKTIPQPLIRSIEALPIRPTVFVRGQFFIGLFDGSLAGVDPANEE
jgi:hypothetical protein